MSTDGGITLGCNARLGFKSYAQLYKTEIDERIQHHVQLVNLGWPHGDTCCRRQICLMYSFIYTCSMRRWNQFYVQLYLYILDLSFYVHLNQHIIQIIPYDFMYRLIYTFSFAMRQVHVNIYIFRATPQVHVNLYIFLFPRSLVLYKAMYTLTAAFLRATDTQGLLLYSCFNCCLFMYILTNAGQRQQAKLSRLLLYRLACTLIWTNPYVCLCIP